MGGGTKRISEEITEGKLWSEYMAEYCRKKTIFNNKKAFVKTTEIQFFSQGT